MYLYILTLINYTFVLLIIFLLTKMTRKVRENNDEIYENKVDIQRLGVKIAVFSDYLLKIIQKNDQKNDH